MTAKPNGTHTMTMYREYDYDLPRNFPKSAAAYVAEHVCHACNGRPWVPDVYGIPATVEASLTRLFGRSESFGDEGTTGWSLPCHLVEI